MAQAPQGGGGAPRQNKTVKEFKGMNTQNRRNAIPEGSFAWLENIQPIGPGHLHSIPGRSTSVVRIPPLIPPLLCTDATERGQQPITIEQRFNQGLTFPGPHRTSWGYITAAEEVFTLLGQATCDGGNMGYDATCCQINHYQTPSILTHPPLIDEDGTLAAVNVIIGTSDEPIYGFIPDQNHYRCYFPNSSTSAIYVLPVGLITSSLELFFAKKGTSIYVPCHNSSVPPFDHHIIEFNAASGLLLNDFTSLPQFEHIMMAATAGFLYVLAREIADATKISVKKIDRSTGAVTATFMLDDIQPRQIGVVNDNLIYVLCAGLNAASLYYIANFTDLVYIGNTPGQGFSPLGAVNGMFVGGAFYYGGNGVGFSVAIFKIAVACPTGSPPTPIIASVSRGSASVAAGADIVVSWADVLLPTVNDHIRLYPAPTPPDLGIVGSPIVSRFTDGLGTSSMNFLIPMGTTPGSYILAYMAADLIFVAKTATFTVT